VPDRAQVFKRRRTVSALTNVRRDATALRGVELVVEIQLDRAALLNVAPLAGGALAGRAFGAEALA
jgi:hypothetical protein